MSESEESVEYGGPVSTRAKVVLALLAIVMALGLGLEELDGLGGPAGLPAPDRLHGTWRLESFAGRPPGEAGIERCLLTFDPDGTATLALRLVADGPAPPALVPGRWRLDGDRLSTRFDEDRTEEAEVTDLEGGRVRLDPDPVLEAALGRTGPGIYGRARD